jgi:hypothetical protein
MERNIVNNELRERAITFLSKVYKYNGFEKKAVQEVIDGVGDNDKKELMADILTRAISNGLSE